MKINEFIMSILILSSVTPVWADIMLSPEQESRLQQEYEAGRQKCPKDKPLFDGEECFSCDEPMTIAGNKYINCDVCPNRESKYECGPSGILKDAPEPGYKYVRCEGWVKKTISNSDRAYIRKTQQCTKGTFYYEYIDETTHHKLYKCYPCDWPRTMAFNTEFEADLCQKACSDKRTISKNKCILKR